MRNSKICFLTLKNREKFIIDDAIVINELKTKQILVDEIPWSEYQNIDWKQYALVIIRTTWDYYNVPKEFLLALRFISNQTRLVNSYNLIEWNINKIYLKDLDEAKIATIPTVFGNSLDQNSLERLLEIHSGKNLVLKPQISGNSFNTFFINQNQVTLKQKEKIIETFKQKEYMAQPLISSIQQEGEYSMFYFGGKFSHSIIKKPSNGDYRVQESYGASIEENLNSLDELKEVSRKIVYFLETKFGEIPFQLRLDFVRLDDGRLAVMEVEAIEPSLYFRISKSAAKCFVRELCSKLD
jgi:glutathione synthase/RimK-type ligase-like ATP-grasp enzyme